MLVYICGIMATVAGVDRNMNTKNSTRLICTTFVVYNIHSKLLLIISVYNNYCVCVECYTRLWEKIQSKYDCFEIHDGVKCLQDVHTAEV